MHKATPSLEFQVRLLRNRLYVVAFFLALAILALAIMNATGVVGPT